MSLELFAKLPIEHQISLSMMVPREAICALLNLWVCQIEVELGNLAYADKDVLQLAYAKLSARRATLMELHDFFETLPTTPPGDSQ